MARRPRTSCWSCRAWQSDRSGPSWPPSRTRASRAPRVQRPGLDALMRGVTRRDFDLVAAWSVDRIGRSLQHLVSFLADLHAKSIDLYLHVQGIDTTTPTGRAMFQLLGVFGELERAIIRERILAGMA